jgi:hypothetical protein
LIREDVEPFGKLKAAGQFQPALLQIKEVAAELRIKFSIGRARTVFCVPVALADLLAQVLQQRTTRAVTPLTRPYVQFYINYEEKKENCIATLRSLCRAADRAVTAYQLFSFIGDKARLRCDAQPLK